MIDFDDDDAPGGNGLPVARDADHRGDRRQAPTSGPAEGTPDTTPEATPVPEDRSRGDLRAGPPASGMKDRFLVEYRDTTMAAAAAMCGVSNEDVEDWLVDDEEFADGFERVNRLKALRIRQKFLDAFDKISDTIIRQAQGGSKHKASMAAAKLALDLAGFGKKSARRVDASSEPDDAEAQQVAKEMGWLP